MLGKMAVDVPVEQDVSAAELALTQNKASLRQLLGYSALPEDFEIEGTLAYKPYPIDLEELQRQALGERPDLQAANRLAPDDVRILDLMALAHLSLEQPAEAEKAAAADRTEAIKIEAEGQKTRYQVEAEGTTAVNKARNILTSEQIAADLRRYLVDRMPEILRESVKPMEKIDSIKIFLTKHFVEICIGFRTITTSHHLNFLLIYVT
jgi:hypothetical protein